MKASMLNEKARQRKTNTVWYYLYAESKKKKKRLIEAESRV